MGLPCPFCSLEQARILLKNDLALAVRDGFPVSPYCGARPARPGGRPRRGAPHKPLQKQDTQGGAAHRSPTEILLHLIDICANIMP